MARGVECIDRACIQAPQALAGRSPALSAMMTRALIHGWALSTVGMGRAATIERNGIAAKNDVLPKLPLVLPSCHRWRALSSLARNTSTYELDNQVTSSAARPKIATQHL